MPQSLKIQARLSGRADVGEDIRVVFDDAAVGDVYEVSWWCSGRCVQSGKGQDALHYTVQDSDDDGDLFARITTAQGVLIETAAHRVSTPAPRLRDLMLDDVMDQHTGLQPLPTAQVFDGRAVKFSVVKGDAQIDPNTGVLHIPTDVARRSGQIVVEGRNSGGAQIYPIQYTVEGDDTRASTTSTSTLQADGVTFTFDRAVDTGTFITGALGAGDPFVVGPVTLLAYTPQAGVEAGRAINGAMLNPPCAPTTAFDGLTRRDTYVADDNVGLALPVSLVPGDSVVVAVSNPRAADRFEAIDHYVVLTCVAETPFADSFRPPYSGAEKPMWRASDIDPGRLARLSNQARGGPPRPSELERQFARFALDLVPTWDREHLDGNFHPPLYGRDLCIQESPVYTWLNLDVAFVEKETALHGMIQRGIDRYGVFVSARDQGFHPWQMDGAHNSGRKFSIMFAGHLLGDDAMRTIVRQSAALGGAFHEDGMTFYVTDDTVEATNSMVWNPPYGDKDDRPKQPYSDAMIGMPDWTGFPGADRANAAWTGNPYRIVGNHNAQHGQVFAALVMGLRDAWGHDAYFDYHMRFMEIMNGQPDPWQFRGGTRALYDPVAGSRPAGGFEDWQVFWRDEWSWRMLMHYRDSYYSYPWT